MTSGDEIPDLFRSLQSDLTARYKVQRIGVFGSIARRVARIDSDVDIRENGIGYTVCSGF